MGAEKEGVTDKEGCRLTAALSVVRVWMVGKNVLLDKPGASPSSAHGQVRGAGPMSARGPLGESREVGTVVWARELSLSKGG